MAERTDMMADSRLDEAERHIIEIIAVLNREHQKLLEPLYRHLASIRDGSPPSLLFIGKDDPLALAILQSPLGAKFKTLWDGHGQ